MKIQGTLDDSNNFVQPSSPVAFKKDGNITIQGTLDANGIFVAPMSQVLAIKDV